MKLGTVGEGNAVEEGNAAEDGMGSRTRSDQRSCRCRSRGAETPMDEAERVQVEKIGWLELERVVQAGDALARR